MEKKEKLKKIDELEAKVRKFERKGYKLMAELKEIQAYEGSHAAQYTAESLGRTIDWCNNVLNTAREWALKGR